MLNKPKYNVDLASSCLKKERNIDISRSKFIHHDSKYDVDIWICEDMVISFRESSNMMYIFGIPLDSSNKYSGTEMDVSDKRYDLFKAIVSFINKCPCKC